MDEKEVVGTYQSIDQVIQKVDVLKTQGYNKDEIMAYGKNATELSMLQQSTGVRSMTEADLTDIEYGNVVSAEGITLMVNKTKSEMDSQSEQSTSGEQLDGQSEDQQAVEGPDTIPRLNTRNL